MAGLRRRVRRRTAGLRRRAPLDPFSSEPRDALELVSMMAGSRSIKDPGVGRSTRPGMSALDVAQALACADDDLGELVALAIACQRPDLWPEIERLALPVFRSTLEMSAKGARMIAGPLRFRSRVVLRSAFTELMNPAQAPTWATLAEQLRMRRDDYVWLHRQAIGLLDRRARVAAGEAKRALFGSEKPPAPKPKPARRPAATPKPAARAPRAAVVVPSMIRYGRLSLRRTNERCSHNALDGTEIGA